VLRAASIGREIFPPSGGSPHLWLAQKQHFREARKALAGRVDDEKPEPGRRRREGKNLGRTHMRTSSHRSAVAIGSAFHGSSGRLIERLKLAKAATLQNLDKLRLAFVFRSLLMLLGAHFIAFLNGISLAASLDLD